MNIAIPATKGFKVPTLAVFFAAALLAALVAGGAWGAFDSGGGSSGLAAPTKITFERSYPTLNLYVVGSQEQADMVLAGEISAQNERYSTGMADPFEQTMVVMVSTPEQEANVSEIYEAWTASGSTVRMIDYR